MYLKQSTAVDVLIGPFVDILDGAAAEVGESPAVKLSKNGQALGAKNDITTPVHDADGYYNCEFDATDTNTVGTLVATVAASATALPVRHEFQVVEEAVYDALYATGAAGVGRVVGTVSNAVGAPTASSVWSDDITEATARHFIGRRIRFTSGVLLDQSRPIIAYELDTAEGKFTVVPFTEAAANNDTFVVEL